MSSRRTSTRDGSNPGTAPAFARVRFAILAAAVAVGLLTACSGSESESPGDSQSSANTTAASTAAAPEDLADEVAQHYFDALGRLAAILDRDLPWDELRDEVGNLKEEYIAVLVPYGYTREEMPRDARDEFDSTVNQAILTATPPAFATLSTAVASLNEAGEFSLAEEVTSFNILTQYVFFELLKEQDPAEAQRLDIP